MSTAFKQVKNGAKTLVASNALNNTTSPLTFSVQAGTGSLFPSPGNGFYVTAYNSALYGDPNDDPNMRIGLCTARSTDSLTVTWGQLGTSITAVAGTPDLRLIMVDQLLLDAYTAINTAETAIAALQALMPAGTVVGTTDSQVLSGKTLTAPTINGTVGGTATFGAITVNSPTVVTPTIASFANAHHDHSNSAGGNGVSMVAASNPYKFRVYRNAALSTGNNVQTVLAYDTKTGTGYYDTGSNIDVVTNKGRFTAPVAGFYRFGASYQASIAGAGGQLQISFGVNGTIQDQGVLTPGASGACNAAVSHTDEFQLSANDYVEVFELGSTAYVMSVGATSPHPVFWGELVSAT